VSLAAELEALNAEWNRAWFEKDVATVERLMAPDYRYIAPDGRICDREAILRIIRSPGYRIHHGDHRDFSVLPLGRNAAVIVRTWEGEGEFDGARFTDHHRCTTICHRRSGTWMVVVEQCSSVEER
jgi:hypothetical protein